jgi:methionyl-tRNA formyltransferase
VRIAFFGLPLAALLLARDGHAVVYAATSSRGPGLRRLRATLGTTARVEVAPDLSRHAAVGAIRETRPDLLVSWFWTTKLPSEVLAIRPAIGVHPSLLPRHRGPDPYYWTIASGDPVTGVTAHRLDAEYDTGAVLAQRSLPIDPGWNAWRLARALDRPSLALLREVVRAYAEGRPPAESPQDERFATQAPALTDEDLAVRWSDSAADVERRVRAAAPWPGAWTEIGDRIVILERVRPATDFPKALVAGEAAVRKDGVAVVRTGDTAVELLRGRDGDDDAVLLAPDLAALVVAAHRGPCDERDGTRDGTGDATRAGKTGDE